MGLVATDYGIKQALIQLGVKEINEGRLADIIILCTGALSAVDQAMQSIDRGGTLLFFAVTFKNTHTFCFNNELFMFFL